MDSPAFLVYAVVLVVLWIVAYRREERLTNRAPSAVEVILGVIAVAFGIFGAFVFARQWGEIRANQDLVLWAIGLGFGVVFGVILEIAMTNLEEGKSFRDIKPYPLLVALATAIPLYLGFWASIEGQPVGVGTAGLAITAGYGWKGFATQAAESARRA